MAGYRKLSRTASQRKALIRNQVTAFFYITERSLQQKPRQKKSADRQNT